MSVESPGQLIKDHLAKREAEELKQPTFWDLNDPRLTPEPHEGYFPSAGRGFVSVTRELLTRNGNAEVEVMDNLSMPDPSNRISNTVANFVEQEEIETPFKHVVDHPEQDDNEMRVILPTQVDDPKLELEEINDYGR